MSDTSTTTVIAVATRLDPELNSRFDRWRRDQPKLLPVSEALRQLMAQALPEAIDQTNQ